jgi:hypothetical protein
MRHGRQVTSKETIEKELITNGAKLRYSHQISEIFTISQLAGLGFAASEYVEIVVSDAWGTGIDYPTRCFKPIGSNTFFRLTDRKPVGTKIHTGTVTGTITGGDAPFCAKAVLDADGAAPYHCAARHVFAFRAFSLKGIAKLSQLIYYCPVRDWENYGATGAPNPTTTLQGRLLLYTIENNNCAKKIVDSGAISFIGASVGTFNANIITYNLPSPILLTEPTYLIGVGHNEPCNVWALKSNCIEAVTVEGANSGGKSGGVFYKAPSITYDFQDFPPTSRESVNLPWPMVCGGFV